MAMDKLNVKLYNKLTKDLQSNFNSKSVVKLPNIFSLSVDSIRGESVTEYVAKFKKLGHSYNFRQHLQAHSQLM